LLEVEHDGVGNIDLEKLISLLPSTPEDVIKQFYVDHGRKDAFQEQYSDLDIGNIHWQELLLGFNDISALNIYPEFDNWVQICKHRSTAVSVNNDWSKIQNSLDVTSFWEQNHTWVRPPVILEGINSKINLVEGHTRLGTLLGLVESGMISDCSQHKVWVGKCV
jgi:hypothetical protein